MSVIKHEFDIFDIYIEPDRKVITIRQRWKYNWIAPEGFTMWTYEEKKRFHDAVDRVVWQQWSGNFFSVSRVDPIEKKKSTDRTFDNTRFTINFDVEWVTANQHWTANVEKVSPTVDHHSKVNYTTKEVFLGSRDVVTTLNVRNCGLEFNTVSHEFGHTIYVDDEYGNEWLRPDKVRFYEENSALKEERFKHDDDYSSRMNIGNELRDRFVESVDWALNEMVPGVRFYSMLTKTYVQSINGRY